MWYLLKKNKDACRSSQDAIEGVAGRLPGAFRKEELFSQLPAAVRAHVDACAGCREAIQDVLEARHLFRGITGTPSESRPFFVSRVMAAIAERERELLVSPWAEVPRFASRLAWVAALLLLAGTTWFYEKGITGRAANGDSSQESIFETPPSAGQDDVLISMVEMHP